jgi:RimJ/RimL family protein N-acetyltransferase
MTPRLTDTPVLETARLILRAPKASDFDALHAFSMSERSRFVRPENPTLGQSWRGLAQITGMWALRGYGLFIVTDKATGARLGHAGPWHPGDWPEAELGWAIWLPEAEGRGYAAEAALAARAHAYDTLGWKTAVSYIHPDNTRSIALAERLGCTPDDTADFPGEGPCHVYRHPSPEALASDGSPEAYA